MSFGCKQLIPDADVEVHCPTSNLNFQYIILGVVKVATDGGLFNRKVLVN